MTRIMSSTLHYRDYAGSVEFSEKDGLLFGKVLGVRALISYEVHAAEELVADFHAAVDSYLDLCTEKGLQPEKAYKGSFSIRISPELHRQAAMYAMGHSISLNSFVETAVQNELARKGMTAEE